MQQYRAYLRVSDILLSEWNILTYVERRRDKGEGEMRNEKERHSVS